MHAINYYVPNTDKVIVKNETIGEGTIRITQGGVNKGSFGVNDTFDTTISLSDTPIDLTPYLKKTEASQTYATLSSMTTLTLTFVDTNDNSNTYTFYITAS